MDKQVAVTQRAYTLRLQGADPQDQSWREALWQTHEAVNKGARAFGDWLLTLRGGLDHTLADAKVKGGKGKPDRDPTNEERRDRRILLALSWLSVESAPKDGDTRKPFVTATGQDSQAIREEKVLCALRGILEKRGVRGADLEGWIKDCTPSLSAAIRDDAVWVNRSEAFDKAVDSIGSSLTRDEVWDMLERFFGSRQAYLAPAEGAEDESAEAEQEDKAKDLVQKAGQWLSSRFGTGKGADFSRMAAVYEKIADWAGKARAGMTGDAAVAGLAAALSEFSPASNDLQGVLRLISGPGYKSATRNLLNQFAARPSVAQEDLENLRDSACDDAEKCKANTGSKGQRAYADAILKDVESVCGFTYLQDGGPARHSEFAVMLDHAARRVSLAHTWIKRAEAERRRFEEDARRMDKVPASVKAWLDGFCLERSEASGALEPYRIRRRAVDGWKELVAAWSNADCRTAEDRIAAARALQDDPEIEKFGDIQLFEALADDEALRVWHKDGDSAKAPDPQLLIDYVLATDAEFKKRQFKVPAYRHPDALLHPVFCDFGNSRWDISFDVHEAVKTGGRNRKNMMVPQDPHALSMTLWTGSTVEPQRLRWQSKRLARDLALKGRQGSNAPEVTRADRLGRAAADVPARATVRIAGVFEQEDWNGRLQAPRAQLDAIAARVARHGWDDKARQMRDHLRWLITFSAKLQPSGPWLDYAAAFPDDAPAKPFVSRKGGYAVRHQDNDAREGHAKLSLSRLPGLRVLCVDLGHRYAAACAVWETLSATQVGDACRAAGREPPRDSDLYLHLKKKVKKQKKGTEVEVEETTIYRRIGADILPDGKPHPAPWARLDRQFLIKLQGEDREARKAGPAELEAVQRVEKEVGREPPDQRALRVDELMSETVRTVRLALQRHGRRARIAFNLTAHKKLLPGGREEVLTAEERIGLLADTLADWYALFTGKGWNDHWARQQWEAHITPLLQGAALPQMPHDAEDMPKARREYEADLMKRLSPVAKSLAGNESLRRQLHCLWATRWRDDDVTLQKCLRRLRDWILPRGRKAKADGAIRHVGGLSLTRIATIKSLYQVQKAFYMRPQPQDLRKNIPSKGDDALVGFGRRILDAMEHMREQRVKQLASRIAEAALGIGRVKRLAGGKDPKRPRQRVDRPCHAVVIENLTHYRPEETRTRRENRQLMSWSSSKVRKYLAEACQLHGLHLREVQAGYTSRQDSRTGAPGVRCQDVPVKQFMQSPFWRKQVAQAEKKRAEGKGDARERFLCDLNAKWNDKLEADWEKAGAVRIPLKGGEIFVSADRDSPAAKGLQADLNAAANIGLKALLDPDWPGRWWYVPCDPATFKPAEDKVAGSAAICLDKPLKNASVAQSTDRRVKKGGKTEARSREVVNLWRDVSSQPISADDNWREFAPYWNDVQARVVRILRQSAGLATDQEER